MVVKMGGYPQDLSRKKSFNCALRYGVCLAFSLQAPSPVLIAFDTRYALQLLTPDTCVDIGATDRPMPDRTRGYVQTRPVQTRPDPISETSDFANPMIEFES
jgi:hypothetical protein